MYILLLFAAFDSILQASSSCQNIKKNKNNQPKKNKFTVHKRTLQIYSEDPILLFTYSNVFIHAVLNAHGYKITPGTSQSHQNISIFNHHQKTQVSLSTFWRSKSCKEIDTGRQGAECNLVTLEK